MSLYELDQRYRELFDALVHSEDEAETENIGHQLMAVDENIKLKVDNVVRFVRSLEADCEAIKQEEARLKQRRQALERKRDGLGEYLKGYVKTAHDGKVKGNTFEIAIRKTPAKLIVDDENKVPMDFIKIKEEKSIDKVALKNHLKLIGHIDGVRLETGEALKIK